MNRTVAALSIAAVIAVGGVATVTLAQTQPDAGQTPPNGAVPPGEGEETPPDAAPPTAAVQPNPAPPVAQPTTAPTPAAAPADKPKPAAAAAAAPEPKPGPKRALYNAAVLQALDKVTTETLRFEAPLNKPIRYKGLIFTVHTCQVEPAGTRPPAEAHLQVISQPTPVRGRPAPPAREVFRGWMYADAPGVHPFEHPVYDVWLIACKTASPVNAPSR